MKKYFVFLCLLSILSSCGDDSEKKFLQLTIEHQKNVISLLQDENSQLKEKLAAYKETVTSANVQRIGRWLDTRPGSDIQISLNKDLKTKKYYVTHKYKDGSVSNEQVRVTKDKGLTKFQIIDSEHIEWYIIEKNGDLSMYSQNGKFATAQCF